MEISKDTQDAIEKNISQKAKELEQEKEKKLLNLLAEILVQITLKELYETSD
ncbi:hypothetical protein [Mucilaginibacter sp.]|uniref:hypothetical protein n=1 Tax=Mucilaginibacter sp. TaxID=1882438 RepID=UPI0026352478|nr:hypothetical protein [Mucilaginibacter sp.]MDB4919093.1 hypothetical protein [Mucilaginibacter sp.]